ncbi:glycoside hydrolase family 97 catalytic domain-containing protein [Pontiellaceae bacterium B1224]|nr:glycoside hydrolase family 97 catalytic domain-containing protein [Pontiellaceae bacterium B1224]
MKHFLMVAGLIMGVVTGASAAVPAVIESPDGTLSASFTVEDDSLFYSVARAGKPVVASSKVEIIPGAKMVLVDQSVRENDTSWEPVWGQFRTIRDHHNELTLFLKADGLPLKLVCRVFDTGIGFRFVLPAESKGRELTFSNEYRILDSAAHYRGQRGLDFSAPSRRPRSKGGDKSKNNPQEIAPLWRTSDFLRFGEVPLVTERGDGLHVGFIESDLYSADPFEHMRVRFVNKDKSFTASSSAVSKGAGQLTAWRTILIGETAGDLVLNTMALNLSAPCKLKDTSWIKPGKGLWDWRVHGYDNGDFKYAVDTRSCLRYIDFCSEYGLEYFTLDDEWFDEAANGTMKVSDNVDIQKVIGYAKEKGVKVILYYDRRRGDFGDDKLFRYYADLGVAGMKYGFMGTDSKFTREYTAFTRVAMEQAAENKEVINFHDHPIPMAGVERTFPNLITREYCHGQQDARTAFTPETFLKMAMVASLSGPLDMSNGNFGIKSINAGERRKGPRKRDSYISTMVSEVARCLVIYTGLVTLPDAPEEYAKKLDLFEFLKVMPVTWDDTLIPNSKIGEYITTARRSGDTWFVGSVNNQEARTLEISLDFLEPGKTYAATLYLDAPDAHGLENPEAYEIKTKTVKKDDVVQAKMALGGGHAMILKPVQ